jgi:hypothetical protein
MIPPTNERLKETAMWRVSARLTKRDFKLATSRQEACPINLVSGARSSSLLRPESSGQANDNLYPLEQSQRSGPQTRFKLNPEETCKQSKQLHSP